VDGSGGIDLRHGIGIEAELGRLVAQGAAKRRCKWPTISDALLECVHDQR
jgi:hypothetical protein